MSQHTGIAQIVPNIVTQILAGLVQSPHVPINQSNAHDAAPVVRKVVREAVEDEMIPRLEHVTNQEPWYQSRVTWGSIISIAAGVLGIFGLAQWDEADQADKVEQIMALVPVVAPILGGVISLIGRWFSTKPIGAGWRGTDGGK
jgi:hypothetical protein